MCIRDSERPKWLTTDTEIETGKQQFWSNALEMLQMNFQLSVSIDEGKKEVRQNGRADAAEPRSLACLHIWLASANCEEQKDGNQEMAFS